MAFQALDSCRKQKQTFISTQLIKEQINIALMNAFILGISSGKPFHSDQGEIHVDQCLSQSKLVTVSSQFFAVQSVNQVRQGIF